jgi:murein DD-endopeptidase MepM/ murein hydrolase activator NlpD
MNAIDFSRFSPVAPVVPPGRFVPFDFTSANNNLTEEIFNDINLFCAYINRELIDKGADYGIGGYNEHRTIYSRSRLFDPGERNEEPRRLHLGVDIWAKAGTPVMAPLKAVVHSFANNNYRGDYGATIILMHEAEGLRFFSLYGHLDAASLNDIFEGKIIEAGTMFARFGNPDENGYWPPHLHFQLILDMEGKKGDYPGVCRFSERSRWLSNCPDPAGLLKAGGLIF